ncbi:hypothetical protein HLRTI_002164 [Halorhabdus tiamatea SARL4B]|uniref:Uncharacterized protein n=1 Tax=Halorhabdus tiamatea SARL4B TaxID=1033806 RepID=F7PJF4_9EURY|nr:hypothetical protein [Halorhabdus tiamatea]ERJ05776.1 hypothetical protein HLRTI_002164 [Halorhabdus tiamatea SARL4B]CCQ34290.1 hypothetical protein HTIA_2178 [Halorhabdus tiamatea SARL4B]
MFGDDPPKVRLSRWFHSESFAKTAAAAVVKMALGYLLWISVLGVVTTIAIVVPLPLLGNAPLFGLTHLVAANATAWTATGVGFCMFTLSADDLD